MSHEHTRNCCVTHELQEEQRLHLAQQLGSLCCTGRCNHPEHQASNLALEQQRFIDQLSQTSETTAVTPDKLKKPEKNKKKTKKKQLGWLAGQLLAAS